jgi:hypothetical protein
VSNKERSGKRDDALWLYHKLWGLEGMPQWDEHISRAHRLFGDTLWCADVDFQLVEVNNYEVVASFEYKMERAGPSKPWMVRALAKRDQRAGVPFFVVKYAYDFDWWKVFPQNDTAFNHLAEPEKMTMREYVRFLYRLRGQSLPKGLFSGNSLAAMKEIQKIRRKAA